MQQILENYYPEFSELTSTQVQEVRERLRAHYTSTFPDLDTSPNSVFGDLWLTPAATHIAAMDMALERYKSDLDLANVAEGIVWDCDFVERYLQNFAPTAQWDLTSYGTVRIVVSSPEAFTMPRHMTINSGETTYRLRLAEEGPLYVLPPDSELDPGINQVVLVPTTTAWIIDVPVYGTQTEVTAPTVGTSFTLSEYFDAIVSVVAVADFHTGDVTHTLSSIARLTRETVYAATLSTKGGVRSFMRRNFPSFLGASPVVMGDMTSTRDNALKPVDLYLRSSQTFKDSIVVRAELVGTRFEAPLRTPAIPLLLGTVTTTAGNVPQSAVNFYYRSEESARSELYSSAYSDLQNLWFSVEMPFDPDSGDPLITTELIEGVEYVDFTVEYYQDPGFKAASAMFTSETNAPMYMDVLPKIPIVCRINALNIRYKRSPGTSVKLSHAKTEIVKYINSVMFPDLISSVRISDSMFYAGVVDVLSLDVTANILYCPANKTMVDDPEAGLTAAMNSSVDAQLTNVLSISDLKELHTPEATAKASPENMQYFILEENVAFEEV